MDPLGNVFLLKARSLKIILNPMPMNPPRFRVWGLVRVRVWGVVRVWV